MFREDWDYAIKLVQEMLPDVTEYPGDWNYLFSRLIWDEFSRDPSYKAANNLLGMLEAVKQEFYRRKVVPYEEKKMKENGDLPL